MTYDLMILGGGPAGYNAAERASHEGMKVVLFEERALGGVCLNEGCIPTKTLLNSAKLYSSALHSAEYGVTVTGAAFDHPAVVTRKNKVVKTLVSGIGAKMRGAKVEVIEATAKLTGKTADGFTAEAAGKTYTAGKVLICTGSEAVVPPVPGLREAVAAGLAVTNREVLDLPALPKAAVVIGGGVIGLEMASYFATVGVEVTVIEMMDKIAGATDREICNLLMHTYAKRGMEFKLSCKVKQVTASSVIYEDDGKECACECDCVLLSVGRRPSTQGVGLESIGVVTERGAVVTDRHMCTNVSGVYAVGDCNGKLMLAHTAYREAEVAVNHMLGIKDEMRYEYISSVIYTDPEVASVGESRESAEAKGMKVKEVKLPMAYAGRYVAETDGGNGFCKVVYDTERDRLVGVHIIGSYASEMIFGAAHMCETELPLSQLKKLVFPHPTVSEIIRECLFKL